MSKTEVSQKFSAISSSLCPECMKTIPMRIYEENGVIYLEKTCPEHGKFDDIYWGDAELFKWFYDNWYNARYWGSGVEKPHSKTEKGCPFDCGICPQHKTPTILGIIDVTNRCNMACPVCFAYVGATNYVYEPTYNQIVEMIRVLRANSPWACNALQFSGGEPTLRNDLPDLIREAQKAGITTLRSTPTEFESPKTLIISRSCSTPDSARCICSLTGCARRYTRKPGPEATCFR